eukprot:Seg1635.1 transcript_id=Seg1635.1/GoldUCD/mRNA.D3Y31 product="hypothetical protein" protein_id=Seg1635.1/GoldUCD/D3Y31
MRAFITALLLFSVLCALPCVMCEEDEGAAKAADEKVTDEVDEKDEVAKETPTEIKNEKEEDEVAQYKDEDEVAQYREEDPSDAEVEVLMTQRSAFMHILRICFIMSLILPREAKRKKMPNLSFGVADHYAADHFAADHFAAEDLSDAADHFAAEDLSDAADHFAAAGHVAAGHVAARHVAARHVAAGHVAARHVAAGHVAAGHVAAGHVAAAQLVNSANRHEQH